MTLCPNKDICGSCSWSHIPYYTQCEQKISDINGSFKLKGLDLTCSEIIPSNKTSHYRNRMDFVINFEGKVGMRQKGKWWRVIDNHTCFISDKKIEDLFTKVRNWVNKSGLSFFDRKSHEGFLRYAVIRCTSNGETMINIITSSATENDDTSKITDGDLVGISTTLIWSVNNTITDVSFGDNLTVIYGPGYIEENINDIKYRISPNAFFQTNSHMATKLQNKVVEYCGNTSDKTLLDLYCGTGFFAMAALSNTKKVVGVEMIEDAIKDARINADINNLNIDFIHAKTENFDWGQYNADIVILDPPRSGMHDAALKDVIKIQPDTIIYVSCNPKNFAREMVQLKDFYKVEKMCAIDMFPHTPHVELVSKLIKK